jgi:hypothetical protein
MLGIIQVNTGSGHKAALRPKLPSGTAGRIEVLVAATSVLPDVDVMRCEATHEKVPHPPLVLTFTHT